jgi:eukaryotic-like serine/threonine-protein kinase
MILDFGIARDLGETSITGTGGLQPGTWKWAAPEQYAGQKDMISYRNDSFSVGVMAYFLYHKKLPFGNYAEDIDAKFKSGDESCSIADACGLKPFLTEAMRFKPSHRPKDIEDLIKLI